MTPTTETAPPSLFHEQQVLRLCSANVCTAGHEWIPKVTLAKCGYGTPQGWNGCGSPVLAVKIEACPICNEPVAYMRFRTDHTPPTQYIIPMCIPGSASPAEVQEVRLDRNYLRVEEEHEKRFPALPAPEAPVEPKQEKS
jgi:hypothetical protein